MKKKIKHIWDKTPSAIRKPGVFIIGWAVVFAGIAMLVLPGPGWAVIFIGFAILATEFASAKRTHEWMVGKLHAIIDWAKALYKKFTKKKR